MKRIYKVRFYSATGVLSKMFFDFDEALNRYEQWCKNFDEDKADGEKVRCVTLTVIENGAEIGLDHHF